MSSLDPGPAAGGSLPRRKIQEALQLFSEIETVDVFDMRDVERLSLASAPAGDAGGGGGGGRVARPLGNAGSAGLAGTAPRGGAPAGHRRSQSQGRRGAGAAAAAAADGRAAATQEAVIRRLHERNKALSLEIAALRREAPPAAAAAAAVLEGSGLPPLSTPPTVVPSPPPAARPADRKSVGGPACAAPPRPAVRTVGVMTAPYDRPASAAAAPAAAPAAPARGHTPTTAQCTHGHADAPLRHRCLQLQRQLEQALSAKLECITGGAATGIVNKEVKAYFVSTRQKVVDDAAHMEAERLHWNTELLRLEAALCDKECGQL